MSFRSTPGCQGNISMKTSLTTGHSRVVKALRSEGHTQPRPRQPWSAAHGLQGGRANQLVWRGTCQCPWPVANAHPPRPAQRHNRSRHWQHQQPHRLHQLLMRPCGRAEGVQQEAHHLPARSRTSIWRSSLLTTSPLWCCERQDSTHLLWSLPVTSYLRLYISKASSNAIHNSALSAPHAGRAQMRQAHRLLLGSMGTWATVALKQGRQDGSRAQLGACSMSNAAASSS